MMLNIRLIAAVVAILAILAIAGKIYYAGKETSRIEQERADNAARDKAKEIERDSARCLGDPACILPDPFRAR